MKTGTPRELFLVAVALAVAAIPEGLPAITTIVLALGTQRMARRNALVRRLPAVETLGCAQVICTDKTGTLTQNAMTVRRLWVSGARYDVTGEPRRTDGEIKPFASEKAHEADLRVALAVAAHAAGAHLSVAADGSVEIQGDPTDAALQMLARRAGPPPEARVLGDQPFTSARRSASMMVVHEGQTRSFVRGAPEVLLTRATHWLKNGRATPLTDADRERIVNEAAAWAAQSMRVIGLAKRDLPMPDTLFGPATPDASWESELTLVALVGIVDPPRPEVAAAIREGRRAGIRTVMITGDHPATARAIAQEIGLWAEGDELVTGGELDHLDQQTLEERIDRVRVVARATAEHKLRIVAALKARGLVCAMTGDGVNDAPAVKSASIGVAMGKAGADVTKEAAALVLADDNYATIVAAVQEGRAIYANIRKFIYFLLSSNAGAVLFVLAASLLGWEAPLAPIQILWINLITNGLPALALGVDPSEPEQMAQPPRDPGGAILTSREYLNILGVGAVMAVTALWAFAHFLGTPSKAPSPTHLALARTVVFAILSIGPLCHAFNCRSERRTLFELGAFSNRALWGAVLVGVALQAITIYVPVLRPVFKTEPLDVHALAVVLGMSMVPFVLVQALLLVLPRK
jgi:Ca2+-transporting ATPase